MASALCLYDDNRIHSAWKVLPNGNYDGMPIVDTLPTEGKTGKEKDITNYFYINNKFIYDPKPEQPEPEPADNLEQRVAAIESDVENLTAAIEKGLAL